MSGAGAAAVIAGVGIGLFTLVMAVAVAADFAARLARYRAYRRLYPLAERGRVWRHVR